MKFGGEGKCDKCGEKTDSAHVHFCEGRDVTVKEMIVLLLEHDMDHYVFVKKDGIKIDNAEICTKEEVSSKGLGVLFG